MDNMDVLLCESRPGAAANEERTLAAAGHAVHRCYVRGQVGIACVALVGRPCPLDVAPIDVAVNVRDDLSQIMSPIEEGALCALHRHIPVVVVGPVCPAPLAGRTITAEDGADLVQLIADMAASHLLLHGAAAQAVGEPDLE